MGHFGSACAPPTTWDKLTASGEGIHLWSANRDGTDQRNIYSQPHGFTTNPTMDPSGRRVAFATCCRDEFPAMIVVAVLGGKVLRPLAEHRDIFFVGGIGWSPDGSHIAFEGTTRTDNGTTTSLWTIRPNGTDLRRRITLPSGGFINKELAWTSDGILYSDGKDLRRIKGTRSHLVLRRFSSVRLSGDGTHIVSERRTDERVSVWYGALPTTPDSSASWSSGTTAECAWEPTLDHDGSDLLAIRVTQREPGKPDVYDLVTWDVHEDPTSAVTLDWIRGNPSADWN